MSVYLINTAVSHKTLCFKQQSHFATMLTKIQNGVKIIILQLCFKENTFEV